MENTFLALSVPTNKSSASSLRAEKLDVITMPSRSKVILSTLSDIIAEADTRVVGQQEAEARQELQAVGFFDLTGSTPLKLSQGHNVGVRTIHRFTGVASLVVEQFNGVVVKELGDGILCSFKDAKDACLAALNVKYAAFELGLSACCGLALGQVGVYSSPTGNQDILGDAVDRCSRIQGLAYPGQILLDDSLHETVKSHLKSYPEIVDGRSFQADVKGIGEVQAWEISLKELGCIDKIKTPFVIHAGGRLSIAEKVKFMSYAENEVIEVGIGLTSFAKYFTGQKPSEFRDHVRALLRKGVNVRCFALDPGHRPGRAYLDEQGDETYETELERAKNTILKEGRENVRKGVPGRLEYYQYRLIPGFHCLGVDIDDPMNGRLLLSPYITGLARAECPVHEVSRLSNPELYGKYLTDIRKIREMSTENDR